MHESSRVNNESLKRLCEIFGFVNEYLHEFEHMSKRVWDVKGVSRDMLEGVPTKFVLNPILWDLEHKMCDKYKIMGPWI